VRPDITGGTYNEIFKLADAVGYMFLDGKRHVLDFNPTENYVGKNPAQMPIIEVPHNMPSDFLAHKIADIKAALGSISEEGQKIVKAVTEFRATVEQIEKPEDLTAKLAEVLAMEEPLKSQCGAVIKARGDALGFELDRKAKAYKAKEQAAA
jgi:hypothetical protein